jgi:tetratricopeptide (TPR) repeat protein
MQLAIQALAAGRAEEAGAICRGILARCPDHTGALHLLGVIAHSAGNLAEARTLLRRAAESPEATSLQLLSYAELACKGVDADAALAATRRAVAVDPQSSLALFCLGNLCVDALQFEQARAHFVLALRLKPGFWQARTNLAVVCGRLGDTAAADAEFARVLHEMPGDADVRDSHAGYLQDLGRYDEALPQAEAAIARAPDSLAHHLRAADIEMQQGCHAAALARLGAIEHRWAADSRLRTLQAHLLRLVDQSDAAVALCREALRIGVESPELLRAYGLALHLAGAEAEALGAFDRAAAAPPRAPALVAAALADKAVVLDQLGRFAEARAASNQALLQNPALAEAWYNRVQSQSHGADDPGCAAIQRLLDSHPPCRDRILLHFALGKARMDAGETAAAFRHWHAGNQLKRATIRYDGVEESRRMAAIGESAFPARTTPRSDPPPGARPAYAGPADCRFSEVPVFIVGMPRSGSTLIEQILASHPDVCGAGELLQLRALFAAALPEGDDRVAIGEESRVAAAALARLRQRSATAHRIIDKDLANFRHLGIIHRIFPRARIIHCRRDPLDTCFSIYSRLFLGTLDFSYELAELGRYYRDYHALMAHWRAHLPRHAFMDMDYESLVAAPEQQTRRMLQFLDLPWDEACMRFFDSGRTVNTSSFAQVRRPIYRSSIGRAHTLRSHLRPLVQALGDLAEART